MEQANWCRDVKTKLRWVLYAHSSMYIIMIFISWLRTKTGEKTLTETKKDDWNADIPN